MIVYILCSFVCIWIFIICLYVIYILGSMPEDNLTVIRFIGFSLLALISGTVSTLPIIMWVFNIPIE